jgi:diguanylate cyclase (GGDEF)-like protein
MDPFAAVAGAAVAVAAVVAVVAARQSVRARRAAGEVDRLRRELAAERHAAVHDHLTGLPNRRGLYCAGTALVREAARRPLVAILVDLDDFKRINDTFGHRAGDEVLVNVARRLTGIAAGGLVARFGGDEFVALLDQPPEYDDRSARKRDELTEIARRITEVLSAPVPVTGGWEVAVRASIGVVAVASRSDLEQVLERADAAMYQAKTARASAEPVRRPGGRGSPDSGGWFTADEQRRRVRAVAGNALTWS